MTFALALLPHLRAGRFDVVHVIDPPLARMLFKLRRRLGLDFRLLFSHGCSLPPQHYPPADHVLEMGKDYYDAAIAGGLPAESLTLLAVGLRPQRFATPRSREELRREYGVGQDTFVVLSIAALDRRHKRTHHLIDEVARLEGDVLLWLDGSLDQGEPDLVDYARQRLGARCRVTHVPSEKVGELHRMADVFAHAATFEAFGLAIAEAACSGLPVLVHDDVHFHWMIANPRCWVDMNAPGALAARLDAARRDPVVLAGLRSMEDARRRFDWSALLEDYRGLYQRVAALPRVRQGGPRANYFWELHA
jgi:glycosyltransferase involved in cell wall biosynthesis